jgi:hypothetical protein
LNFGRCITDENSARARINEAFNLELNYLRIQGQHLKPKLDKYNEATLKEVRLEI